MPPSFSNIFLYFIIHRRLKFIFHKISFRMYMNDWMGSRVSVACCRKFEFNELMNMRFTMILFDVIVCDFCHDQNTGYKFIFWVWFEAINCLRLLKSCMLLYLKKVCRKGVMFLCPLFQVKNQDHLVTTTAIQLISLSIIF